MKENNLKRKAIKKYFGRMWSAFLYLFIVDEFKIIKSDKKLLKFSILYNIIYWICICILLFTCFPIFQAFLAYCLKCSTCNHWTLESHIRVLESYMKLFMITSFLPVLIGSMAYFRIRHIRSIKFYRRKLNINS